MSLPPVIQALIAKLPALRTVSAPPSSAAAEDVAPSVPSLAPLSLAAPLALAACSGSGGSSAGSATAAAPVVAPVAVPEPDPIVRRVDSVAMNLAPPTYYSTNHPFMNRMRTAGDWHGAGPGGYPNAYAAGQTRIQNTLALEATNDGQPLRYVIRHNGTGNIHIRESTIVSGAGSQRVIFDWAPGIADYVQAHLYLDEITVWPTNIEVLRLDHEKLYDSGERFTPAFVNRCRRWSVLRFMDWGATNGSPRTSWESRPPIDYHTWSGGASGEVPIEIMVALCNRTKCGMWYCIPFHYTDEAITKALTYIRDALDKSLRVIVEFSNEVWNFGFQQAQDALKLGAALTINGQPGNWIHYAGYRTAQTMAIARSVFSGSARLTCIAGGQTGNVNTFDAYFADGVIAAGRTVAEVIDQFAITYYLEGGFPGPETAEDYATWMGWARDGNSGMTAAFDQLRNGGRMSNSARDSLTFSSFSTYVDQWKDFVAKHNVGLATYEGNLYHWVVFTSPEADQATLLDFTKRMQADPRTAALQAEVDAKLRASGVSLITQYCDIGPASKFGPWGLCDTLYSPTSTREAVLAT